MARLFDPYCLARAFAPFAGTEDPVGKHRSTHRRSSNYGARAQHFLRPHLARDIVRRLAFERGSTVVDIGAGRGALTSPMADRGFRVIALEKDARLYRSLRARFIGRTNVECYRADALTFPLPHGRYSVVANIPFGITAPLVRRLLASPVPPTEAWLIVQREAAHKFAGEPRSTLFHLVHAPWFALTIERTIASDAFVPMPRVEAALLRIAPREDPWLPRRALYAWRRFIDAGMRGAGPEVQHNLRGLLTRNQMRAAARHHRFALTAAPADLTAAQWLGLFRFYELVCVGRRGCRRLIVEARSPMMEASRTLSPD